MRLSINRKFRFSKIALSVFVFFAGNTFLFSQCNNTTVYPPSPVIPTNTWTAINPCNYAGEYAMVNVVAGRIYSFSTLASTGSTVNFDSQLTLRDNSGNLLEYNDDVPGYYQSYIEWEATYSGVVQIHLNAFNCSSIFACYSMMMMETIFNSVETVSEQSIEFKINSISSSGIFEINCSSEKLTEPVLVNIYSLVGTMIQQSQLSEVSSVVDLSNQSNGMYIFEFTNENRTWSSTKKVMIQK